MVKLKDRTKASPGPIWLPVRVSLAIGLELWESHAEIGNCRALLIHEAALDGSFQARTERGSDGELRISCQTLLATLLSDYSGFWLIQIAASLSRSCRLTLLRGIVLTSSGWAMDRVVVGEAITAYLGLSVP